MRYNPLPWRHNERNGDSNHQPHGGLLNRLFRRISKKTTKLRVTALCEGNSPVIDEFPAQKANKQRFLTPGHQGWNDLHSLCRIGMEYYLLNNDDNNIIYWIMMIIMIMMMMIIIMMTMMIIGTATIMIMIIIITTTLTMTIMKMIMIKTAQTPCQSLYKDRRI